MMPRRHRLIGFLAGAIALVTPALASAAGTPDECVAAADSGQEMRDDGKLRAAVERFRECSDERCPRVVAKDCVRWLEEVDARMPSLVLDVHAPDGHDLRAVRVFVDGTLLTSELDGKALAVDPGPHALRFESVDFLPTQLDIVVKEAEKFRRVKVDLAAATTKGPPAPPVAPNADKPVVATTPSATPIFVLGGIGIAGIATFGVLGAMGQSTKNDLASSCAPRGTCSDSDVSGVRTQLLVADVALGVGVLALAAGVYFFVRHHAEPAPTRR